MPITANDTNRKSWLEVPETVIFHYKTFRLESFPRKCSSCRNPIGNYIIDPRGFTTIRFSWNRTHGRYVHAGYSKRFYFLMAKTWRLVRNRIAEIFDIDNSNYINSTKHKDIIIFLMWKMSKCNCQF
jgi:fumarylacetoacetase